MAVYKLPVAIEPLEEGGYLLICPAIQGCHAEGRTIGEALDNLRDVARVIYELCQEKGLTFIADYPEADLESVIWNVKIPLAVKAA